MLGKVGGVGKAWVFAIIISSIAFIALSYMMRPTSRRRVIETFDVRWGRSPLGGRGVFAERAFEPGDVIEIAPTLSAPRKSWGRSLVDYVFAANSTDDTLVLGYGAVYNHADDPNARYEIGDDEDTQQYVARRHIPKDEEITISYGDDWWSTRRLHKN